MVKILNNQQIKYCNLVRTIKGEIEYLPGVSYQEKLYSKKAIFLKTDKEEAMEYSRSQFLEEQGKTDYLFVKDSTGYTVWVEDTQVKLWDKSEDEVERIELENVVEKMRNSGGIEIKNRRFKLIAYENCFIGSEVVA